MFYFNGIASLFDSIILLQALVEKDWLAFGHPFSDRAGLPTLSGSGNMPSELTRQVSVGSISPLRQMSGSSASQTQNSSHGQNNCSPIFLQVCMFFRLQHMLNSHFILMSWYCVLKCTDT